MAVTEVAKKDAFSKGRKAERSRIMTIVRKHVHGETLTTITKEVGKDAN